MSCHLIDRGLHISAIQFLLVLQKKRIVLQYLVFDLRQRSDRALRTRAIRLSSLMLEFQRELADVLLLKSTNQLLAYSYNVR